MHIFLTVAVGLRTAICFQAAQESELPVTANIGPEGSERAIASVDTASPSSNAQLPVPAAVPPMSVPDFASTAASLRMVFIFLHSFYITFFCICLCANASCIRNFCKFIQASA